MTDFNLNAFTVDELNNLADQIKVAKAAKKVEVKENAAAAKAALIDQFKGNLNAGDTISFLYGRGNDTYEGTVVRTSEKSVTVRSAIFAENGKKDTNYVRYDRIVEVLVRAEVAPVASEVPENPEALAEAM